MLCMLCLLRSLPLRISLTHPRSLLPPRFRVCFACFPHFPLLTFLCSLSHRTHSFSSLSLSLTFCNSAVVQSLQFRGRPYDCLPAPTCIYLRTSLYWLHFCLLGRRYRHILLLQPCLVSVSAYQPFFLHATMLLTVGPVLCWLSFLWLTSRSFFLYTSLSGVLTVGAQPPGTLCFMPLVACC